MLVFVKIHHARATPHLRAQARFFDGMPRKLTAVFVTPVVNLLDETVDEKLVHRAPVSVSERIRAVAIDEEFSEFRPQIHAVFFLEIRNENGRIWSGPPVILRFVRKKSEHIFAEIFAAFFFVSFVSEVDKLPDYRFIENIDDGRVRFKINVDVFSLAERLFRPDEFIVRAEKINRGCGSVERIVHFFFEIFLVISLIFKKFHSGKTARPAVFVVTPGVHVDFFAFVNASLDALEPSFAEIFGFQPASRVHKEPPYAFIAHYAYLTHEFFGLKVVVPTPERNRSVISEITL